VFERTRGDGLSRSVREGWVWGEKMEWCFWVDVVSGVCDGCAVRETACDSYPPPREQASLLSGSIPRRVLNQKRRSQ